jgi:hypothetical protein
MENHEKPVREADNYADIPNVSLGRYHCTGLMGIYNETRSTQIPTRSMNEQDKTNTKFRGYVR